MAVTTGVDASVLALIERQVEERRQIGVQVCAYHRGVHPTLEICDLIRSQLGLV